METLNRTNSKLTNFDPDSGKSAYLTALRLLNSRDYTSNRLYKKLAVCGYDTMICQSVIAQLQSEGWLNDLRYAERFAESAISSGRYFGQRLCMEMKRRGFTEDVIDNTLEQIRQTCDEDQEIQAIFQQRYAGFSYTHATDKEKNRIIGYLQRKGFGLSAIFRVMKSEITDRG